MRFKFRGAKMNDGEVRLAKWWTTEGDIKHMSTQDAKDRQRQRQSGKSMGEFGENYSYRKRYQHDYHDSSGVEWVEPNITPQGKPIKYVPGTDVTPRLCAGAPLPLNTGKSSQLKSGRKPIHQIMEVIPESARLSCSRSAAGCQTGS